MAPDHEHDGGQTDDQGGQGERPDEDGGDVVLGDGAERGVGHRDGLAGDHGRQASEDEHATQGGHEAGHADVGDPEAVPRADGQADRDHQEDRGPPRDPVLHGQGAHAADERDHGAHGQIDVRGDDDHQHADGGHEHVRVLLEQGDHVVRIQQAPARQDLEDDDHQHEGQVDAVGTHVAQQQGLQALFVPALLGCGGYGCGRHFGNYPFKN